MSNDKQSQSSPAIHPRHLEDLRKSLLSDETIRLSVFTTGMDAAKIGKALNWNGTAKKLGVCLHLPYFTLSGELIRDFARFKPLAENRPLLKGKKAKYLSPKGGGTRLYFPPRSRGGRLQNPSQPIIVVEGEKKAALLDQLGYAVIGLCGVSCWSAHRAKGEDGRATGERELHPDFAGIPLAGRSVCICFDADVGSKPGVASEEFTFASTLQTAGAVIKCIRIPDDPDTDKTGIDDYLAATQKSGGNPKKPMDELIEKAIAPKPPVFGLWNTQVIEKTNEKGEVEKLEMRRPGRK